ncbi:retrotransposon protein [Cucumis melo var. makuwa]|uniref:Retrotransposon protein n=1 Tax=Cucumis melo var. makuwa TaxID=1194695 RepID=A0A5A7V8K4_CUCMM|nr:retrotransposon protein [Cucumis melo var. makuwa]
MHMGEISTNVLGVCDTKGDFIFILGIQMGRDFSLLREGRGHLQEYFNMKHSSAWNVIECVFDLLKGRWPILCGKSYYPVQVQCRTILACCLLHNLITREMMNTNDLEDIDKGDSTMTNSSRDPKHIWTKEEEATLVECLAELSSTGGWKLDNGMFRRDCRIKTLKWTFQAIIEMHRPSCSGFGWNDEAKCIIAEKNMFDNWVRDMVMDRGAETIIDVGSNDPGGIKGFQTPDENDMEISTMGTPEDSCVMLSTFSHALIRNSLGTYTAEEADDEGRFNTNERRSVESDLKRERWKAILSGERS